MATNDSASYQIRFNEVSQTLEYAVNGAWITVPLGAANITSGAAANGEVLTADGSGGVSFA